MVDENANGMVTVPRPVTEMDIALGMYSDIHKDVFGFRPRGIEFATLQDVHEAIQDLIPLLEEQETRRREEQADNWDAYKTRIQKMATDLNIDQATAIRWDMEAEGIDIRDYSFYCYLNDLSYDREADIKEMMQ